MGTRLEELDLQMFNLFGKPKKEENTPLESIQKLRQTLDTLEKREAHLQKKIDKETTVARANVKKNRRAALMAVKRKKVYEKQMDQLMGSRMTLETQIMALEQAQTNMEVFNAARMGAQGLAKAHNNMNVDEVDDEIGSALSQPIGMGADLYDDDLEAELDDLEQGMIDEQFLDVGAPSTSLPAGRVADPAMPSAPSHVPVAAAETDEERELRELEASMMA